MVLWEQHFRLSERKAASFPAGGPLLFKDHNCNPGWAIRFGDLSLHGLTTNMENSVVRVFHFTSQSTFLSLI